MRPSDPDSAEGTGGGPVGSVHPRPAGPVRNPAAGAQPMSLAFRGPESPQVGSAFLRRWLYALTLFCSAFLLFVIQPAAGKRLLPALGGAVAVWTSCQAFFQVVLVAGYVVAHLGIRWLGPVRQPLVQGLMLAFGLLAPVGAVALQVPATAHLQPVWYLLGELTVTVGLPVLALSTLAPALQAWFAAGAAPSRVEGPPPTECGGAPPEASEKHPELPDPGSDREGVSRTWEAPPHHLTGSMLDRPLRQSSAPSGDPFTLYAASNLGSLAGLLAYPLLIEPWIPLTSQLAWWRVGYAVVFLLVLGCGFLVPVTECRGEAPPGALARPDPIPWSRRLSWVGWAFVPSSLMLGLTAQITMDVAPIPLLWVLPLATYLLSWILPFSGAAAWNRPLWLDWMIPSLMGVTAVVHVLFVVSPAWLLVLIALLLLFGVGLECHGRLFGDRPDPSQLTGFYLSTALGGMLGGGFNSWVAPLLFPRLYELPLVLVLAAFGFSLARPPLPGSGGHARRAAVAAMVLIALLWRCDALAMGEEFWGKLTVLGSAVAVSGLGGWHPGLLGPFFTFLLVSGSSVAFTPSGHLLAEARSFYGMYRVQATPGGTFHHLKHGNIHHGGQKRIPPEARMRPLFYYIREGPVGDLFTELRRRRASRIAVVGLGAGTLACYLRPWQEMVFFEIDPVVTRLASNPEWFSYLASATGLVRVVEGDARLVLRDREPGPFDALIIDAYSSDAIPLHLLTREAFELFRSRLKPGGLLCLHISQRYLDLEPVVGNLAVALGWSGLVCPFRPDTAALRLKYDDEDMPFVFGSTWLVMAPTFDQLGGLRGQARWRPLRQAPNQPLWTDEISSVLSCYRWD